MKYTSKIVKVACIVCLLALLVFVPSYSSAQDNSCDWPCFKGNSQRTGEVAEGCGDVSGKMRLVWKENINTSWSESVPAFAPVVANGRVYVGSKDGKLYAFDLSTGNKIFYDVGSPIYSSPALYEDKIFFGADDGKLYCIIDEMDTGTTDESNRKLKKAWEFDMEGKPGKDDVRSSPVIDRRGYIYCGSYNSSLYCFDATKIDEPKLVWEKPYIVTGKLASSPVLDDDSAGAETKLFVITSSDNRNLNLYRLLASKGRDALDDSIPEKKELLGNINMVYSTPTISKKHNLIVFGTSRNTNNPCGSDSNNGGKLYFYDSKNLDLRGVFDPQCEDKEFISAEKDFKEVSIKSSPSISGDFVYFSTMIGDNSKMYCVSISEESFGKLVWSFKPDGGRFILSSPLIVSEHVIFGCHDGNLYCLDKNNGNLEWFYKTESDAEGKPYPIVSSPAYSDGKILFAAGSDLYCLGYDTVLKYYIGITMIETNIEDSEWIEMNVTPVIKNGRTLLPARSVTELLGGDVAWDGSTRKVTCTLGNTVIEMFVGKSVAYVNGKASMIDEKDKNVVPEIINDYTLVPMRFLAENLGCKVRWDAETKTVTLFYPN